MSRVAAIDCGTNSVRLLIMDGTQQLVRLMRIVRLGAGVDRTFRLDPAAIERTRLALVEYRTYLESEQVTKVRMVATSATRDAINRSEFVEMVRSTLGVEPEVVSGLEEAALSFSGAVAGLPALQGAVIVTDIGGGSSELVLGRVGADQSVIPRILSSHSMDVGSVRLTERHLRDDPPAQVQVLEAEADVAAALATAAKDIELRAANTLIGVAGTVTTIAAMVLNLVEYDSAAIHGATLTREQVRSTTDWLLRATREERAAVPAIHPGRVDVIAAGALILGAVMDACAAESITVSETDILDGIAASIR